MSKDAEWVLRAGETGLTPADGKRVSPWM